MKKIRFVADTMALILRLEKRKMGTSAKASFILANLIKSSTHLRSVELRSETQIKRDFSFRSVGWVETRYLKLGFVPQTNLPKTELFGQALIKEELNVFTV